MLNYGCVSRNIELIIPSGKEDIFLILSNEISITITPQNDEIGYIVLAAFANLRKPVFLIIEFKGFFYSVLYDAKSTVLLTFVSDDDWLLYEMFLHLLSLQSWS